MSKQIYYTKEQSIPVFVSPQAGKIDQNSK